MPEMVPVTLKGWLCERCSHLWVPREKDRKPRVCPKCKSPYWDRPRRSAANREALAKGAWPVVGAEVRS